MNRCSRIRALSYRKLDWAGLQCSCTLHSGTGQSACKERDALLQAKAEQTPPLLNGFVVIASIRMQAIIIYADCLIHGLLEAFSLHLPVTGAAFIKQTLSFFGFYGVCSNVK